MYAVFETGGKQYRAEPGTRIRIPTLQAEAGEKVTFDQVLMAGEEGAQIHVGIPTVAGATVTAEILRHGRAPKVIIFKRKRRDGYRRKKGHRQGFTEIRVEAVALA
jgi:large subunit ribosomal protein L21